MKKALNFSVLFFISSFTFSQTIPINIRFIDINKNPIIGVSVKFFNRNDSTKIFYNLTDTSGIVKFSPTLGQYTIKATSIAFKNFEKGISINTKN
jgi:hypothetical protein